MIDIARMILSDLIKHYPRIPYASMLLTKSYLGAYKACKRQWNASEIEKFQSEKLRSLMTHAYNHVKYYHEQFDSIGIKPNDIKTREDLFKLPTLTKEDLRTHFNELIADNIKLKKCSFGQTSGSTGEPTINIKGINEIAYTYSAVIRQQLACGIRFGERFLNVVPTTMNQKLVYISYFDGFHKKCSFPVWQENMDTFYIEKFRPTVIYCAPSYIKALAHKIETKGGVDLNLKGIISSSEMLDQGTREYISNVFNSEIFDYYGASEGNIAWECPEHVGYHIDADTVIVEILKDDEPVGEGERGEIALTYLHSYARPLIRYKIGDIGTFTEELCPCGRKLPLMKSVMGRKVDIIVRPDGQVLPPYDLMNVMGRYIISNFEVQIIQEKKDLVVIKFVTDTEFTPKILDEIENKYRKILGDEMKIKLLKVDKIDREKSGKLRTVISKVRNPYNSLGG